MSLSGFSERFALLKEVWAFLRVRKKWWLAPLFMFLIVMGLVLIFAEGSAIAPFIYAIF